MAEAADARKAPWVRSSPPWPKGELTPGEGRDARESWSRVLLPSTLTQKPNAACAIGTKTVR